MRLFTCHVTHAHPSESLSFATRVLNKRSCHTNEAGPFDTDYKRLMRAVASQFLQISKIQKVQRFIGRTFAIGFESANAAQASMSLRRFSNWSPRL